MTSIPSAAPVQAAQSRLSPQSQAPSQSNSDADSFQNYLKASAHRQQQNEQDDAVPQRPLSSSKDKAGKDQKDELTSSDRKKTGTELLSVPVQQPLEIDTRSLRLSWPQKAAPDYKAAAGGQTDTQAGEQPSLPESLPKAAAASAEHALQKHQIAFSVNLPKTGDAKPAAGVAGASSVSKTAVPGAVKPVAESKSSSGKQQHSNSSDGGQQGSAAEKDVKHAETSPKLQATTPVVNFANSSAAGSPATPHVESRYSATQLAQPVKTSEPAPVASVTEPQETPAVRSQNIDLKIAGADNSQVDVRISQRAGDVQVTVRTPDGDLAQSLRQHLPELSDRLAQAGVHSDLWQPATAQSSNTSSNNSDSRYSDDAQSQQQRQQQNSRRDSQEDRQQQEETGKASWLNELNNADKKRS